MVICLLLSSVSAGDCTHRACHYAVSPSKAFFSSACTYTHDCIMYDIASADLVSKGTLSHTISFPLFSLALV